MVGFKLSLGLSPSQTDLTFAEAAMASSLCRSASRFTSRSIVSRSKILSEKFLSPVSQPSLLSSPSSSAIPRASRILSVMGSVESMMPLHSAIANARLVSSIAVDSSCWSWLSRGLHKTL
ncbi:protein NONRESPONDING TO OXYLIPINS 2, mitochondrial isoform X1 [Prosopis cineraria]|uniref:protein NONRESPONDING TO OXYLIPINS 2, mitochondrial isoform X1 n=1 Tax=Prosopis cineraria TaxID=364024 RepID=UPI00240F4DE4|nr:protein NONRESPONDING TO OXYLIPINS 2, mitochondrial isoform X1 [Prosopis cineraria]